MAAATRLRLRCQDLPEGGRVQKEIHGRSVTLVKSKGVVYCIDAACYHQGGPLGEGDIEEVCGIPTIRCPWHAHKISLETGSLVDTNLQGKVCERHAKQRVHKVYTDTDGTLSVAINTSQFPQWESDKYNTAWGGAEANQLGGQQSHGYGLGSFEPQRMVSAAPESDEEMSEDMAICSQPEPLIPYGGLDKYYLPPSPAKPKQPPNSASKAHMSRPTLPQTFKGRKIAGSNRGAIARSAVLQNHKPPPMAAGAEQGSSLQQRPLTFFFQPVATAPTFQSGTEAMQH